MEYQHIPVMLEEALKGLNLAPGQKIIDCTLGGAGYTTDFPVEQFYREARIHPIHEGTTAIHGLDLLGRKIIIKNGKSLMLLVAEILKTIEEANQFETLKPHAATLTKYLGKTDSVTKHLLSLFFVLCCLL